MTWVMGTDNANGTDYGTNHATDMAYGTDHRSVIMAYDTDHDAEYGTGLVNVNVFVGNTKHDHDTDHE